MKKEEKILKALANQRRLKIIRFLKQEKVASVADISDAIVLSFDATSRHLNILYKAGILDRDQQQLYMFYRLSDKMPNLARRVIDIL